ncbi:MAG: flavin monoamine oxidase family protein [Gemmatimonadales bacterium]
MIDSLVIGAGVAGLAAARELSAAGADFLVLEARERIGGRIYTVRDSRSPVPIELGAEFVHGAAPETMEIVRAANLRAIDVSGDHWQVRGGKLRPFEDFWHEIDLVMRRIDTAEPDRSFARFLESAPGGRSLARQRVLALEFVQGFHAADAEVISALALAEGGSPGEDPEQQRMGRVLDGYDRVPATISQGLLDRIQTGSVVSRVGWERGRVRVTLADGRELGARTALITVPLGVLLARDLVVEPSVPTVEGALRCLAVGTVIRISLLFEKAFWEDRPEVAAGGARPYDFGFLHASKEEIPVWWTSYPARAPVIVGWVGGPMARALDGRSPDDLTALALRILSRLFRVAPGRLRRLLQGSWTHDWDHDPYARGAYSYPRVNGMEAGRLLARPVARTLFFAGEAADPEGRNGTVDGALASGKRAARAVIRALA